MTQHSHNTSDQDFTTDQLPVVSSDVIELFGFRPAGVDALAKRMQQQNPALAHYLLVRAQELSPGEQDIYAKEKIARLAIEMYALLANQIEVNNFEVALAGVAPLPPQAT